MPEQLTPEVIAQTPDVTLADVTDQDALLAELVSLSPIDYDRQREKAAKLLGVRVSTLDAEVAAKRSKLEEQHVTEQLAAATPAPWPESVDGAQLLARIIHRDKRVHGIRSITSYNRTIDNHTLRHDRSEPT